jgi:hypothetical protein
MSVEGEAPSGRIGDDLAADLDRPTPAEEISEWAACIFEPDSRLTTRLAKLGDNTMTTS